MNIILFTKSRGRPLALRVSEPGVYSMLLLAFAILSITMFYMGYSLKPSAVAQPAEHQVVQQWKQEIAQQQQQLEGARENAQARLNALSLRVGQLQAHVLRMDALGQRLTKMAKLDKGEFDFDQPPAQGGPASSLDEQLTQVPEFIEALDQLQEQMEDREQQLSVLESMMLHSNLQQQVFPAGRPIKSGWTSSYFGMRTDPFTGKRAHHDGMDFAGKMGADVVAVAAGVVTWSGDRYGYGNLVEIDHGNGYVTRYGHNRENLVKVGDTLEKGQVIAKMGSSGRSTGPHVHFEMWNNGKVVDPAQYIQASR